MIGSKKSPDRRRRIFLRCLLVLVILGLCGLIAVLILNHHVKETAAPRILTPETVSAAENPDCILILGCGVREDGSPSLMLRDRLDMGIALYKAGAAPKLLMSGDHGQVHYDEVNAMKDYAIAAGIPSEDIFMDHAGFSTYESMYRAGEIFQVKRMIVVSQEYHLYRSLYNADQLGLEAWGVAAEDIAYYGSAMREAREILARAKDYLYCLFQPEPTFLGEAIPISGDGNLSNG